MSLRVTREDYEMLSAKIGKAHSDTSQPETKPTYHKYGAVKKRVDGIMFDSTAEATRYLELKLLAIAGDIQQLRVQEEFSLDVNGVHVCTYIADFVYFRAGEMIVEDVKGMRTPTYRLKVKLLKACTGLTVIEINKTR